MLRELCYEIEIFNSYCDNTLSLTPQLKESSIESGLALLSFFSQIVKFMRSDIVYTIPGQLWSCP